MVVFRLLLYIFSYSWLKNDDAEKKWNKNNEKTPVADENVSANKFRILPLATQKYKSFRLYSILVEYDVLYRISAHNNINSSLITVYEKKLINGKKSRLKKQ